MIRQPGQTSSYYLPLLEGHSGKVYLNTGKASVVDVETYNGLTPVGDQVIKSGILSINTGSDPIYQGRLSLAYSGTSFELDYNGNNWSDNNGSVVPSSFYLALDYKDAAWVVSGGGSVVADLFPITNPAYSPIGGNGGGPIISPNAPTGPTYSYAGGSRVALQVIPLVKPEVASVSPSSITANGIQQAITITLKRPLNPAQSPNVVFSSSELTIVPGIVVNKNSYGSIIGWTVNVIAPSQAFATGSISMSASEPLQYLKVDTIVTETVAYMTNIVIGSLSIAGAIAATINSITVTAPTTSGWTSTANGTQQYAGNVLVAVTAQSTANNFSSAKIIAKPNGTTSRTDLGSATPNGQPYTGNTTSGGIVYYQDYTLTVDTGVLLNTSQSYDIGASVTTLDLATTTLWSSNTFWNCNPTSQFSAYSMFCQVNNGTGIRASSVIWNTTGGIPATNWTSPDGTVVNPLSLAQTSTNLVFSIQEVWTKQAGAKDAVLKAELRLGTSPGTLLATATTRDATGALVFPAILPTALPVGTNSLFVRIYSQASTYFFTGTGYLDTPAQPVVMTLTTTGGGGPGGPGCFVPETYVMTVDGPKKLNDIKIGNLVMSVHEKDYESGVSGLKPFKVLDKLVHNDKPYSTLNINGILTTDEHIWATDENRFDRADKITKVMAFDLVDQTPVAIAAVKLAGLVVPEVQNLTVEDAHTFLVAPSMFGPWFLVHNMKSKSTNL